MDKNRKILKEYSVVILILAALSLVRLVVDFCVNGFNVSNTSVEGVTESAVKIATIIIFAIGLLLLIPDVYVGVKGIKEANNPTGKGAHIAWALIIAVLSAIGAISAIIDITKGFDISKLLAALDVAADAAIFFAYYLTAKKVANN